MKLTPGQIAELRSAPNCIGHDPVLGPLYGVAIQITTYKRVQELTALGEMAGILWYYVVANGDRVHLATNQPAWFVELEGKMEDARRPL